MRRVIVKKYEIIITDLSTGLTDTYNFGSYDEAINYYALYKDGCKNCKVSLYALLLEDIVD